MLTDTDKMLLDHMTDDDIGTTIDELSRRVATDDSLSKSERYTMNKEIIALSKYYLQRYSHVQ